MKATAIVTMSLFLLFSGASRAEDTVVGEQLMHPAGVEDSFIGNNAAEAVLIVYSSPTCGHCVEFERQILPELNRKYVRSGKLKISVRPFARNVIDAAIFMVAERAGKENFRKVVAAFANRHGDIIKSDDRRSILREIAASQGIGAQGFNAALENASYLQKLDATRKQAMEKLGVTGTPSFFLNGTPLSYDGTIASFDRVLHPS